MTPRTKFERRIVALMHTLPPVPEGMWKWVYNEQIDKTGETPGFTSNGKVCYCGCCGHSFIMDGKLHKQAEEARKINTSPCAYCNENSCEYFSGNLYYGIIFTKAAAKKWRRECWNLKNIKVENIQGRCPNCGRKLRINVGRKRVVEINRYASMLMAYEGIQLYRTFKFAFRFEKGKTVSVKPTEFSTRWINENGTIRTTRKRTYVIERDENGLRSNRLLHDLADHNIEKLAEASTFSLDVDWNAEYKEMMDMIWGKAKIYPKISLVSFLKKRVPEGFTAKDFETCGLANPDDVSCKLDPVIFISSLIKYPFMETLIKERNYAVLNIMYDQNARDVSGIIPAYFIMRRHKYVPEDLKLWIDMVLLYYWAKKDIKNPRFICPDNLAKGHQEAQELYELYIEKERKRREEEFNRNRPHDISWYLDTHPGALEKCAQDPVYLQSLVEDYGYPARIVGVIVFYDEFWDDETGELRTIIRCEWEYDYSLNEYENKSSIENRKPNHPILNLEFGDDDLRIKSLDSWEEYYEEGKAMHNCVETNRYWRQTGSLILSVRKDGKRVADVQLNLKSFKIMQCGGPCNKKSKYEDRIRKLIEENIPLIQERLKEATE